MCIAVAGLGIICMGGSGQHVQLTGILLMLMSVLIYCASIFWVKKVNAPLAPMAQATGSILVSALVALCMVPFIWADLPSNLPSTKSILALLYAVIMASLIAMFCYFKLVQNIKATTLSLTTVMTPMLAIVVGAVFNNEKLTLMVLCGAGVLILGLCVYFYKDFRASRMLTRNLKS